MKIVLNPDGVTAAAFNDDGSPMHPDDLAALARENSRRAAARRLAHAKAAS